MKRLALIVLAMSITYGFPTFVEGHDQDFATTGKKLKLFTKKGPEKARLVFKSTWPGPSVLPDPAVDGAGLIISGAGESRLTPETTGFIELDNTLWTPLGNPAGSTGYKYIDKTRSRGGVTKVIIRPAGKLLVIAKGIGIGTLWNPVSPQDEIWVHFIIEQENYCARFGGTFKQNLASNIITKDADSPGACPDQVCGNKKVELGEDCDDGNLDANDGCNEDCTTGACDNPSFNTTFEGIQSIIFDAPVYACTNAACHGGNAGDPTSGQGDLNLNADVAYEALMGTAGTGEDSPNFPVKRIFPGEPVKSLLYQKLAALTLGHPLDHGSGMPSGATPLTPQHLQAIEKWIRGGAPEDSVVEGTGGLLGSCLPDPDPLIIPVPDAPGAGAGAQFQQPPYPLSAQSEGEVCSPSYYDLTVTDLVPEFAKRPCPRIFLSSVCDNDDSVGCQSDADCNDGASCVTLKVCQNNEFRTCTDSSDCTDGAECIINNVINTSNECFAYHGLSLAQDPQSHHSFIRIYAGRFPTTDSGWGDWTYKSQDPSDPALGTPCDPTDVDPETGTNWNCSGEVVPALACINYGPADFGEGASAISSSTAPTFYGSQEPYTETEYADGVYSILPMQGILVWNSHAFNLTNGDSTMSQYLNVNFAEPADQLYPLNGIVGIDQIFIQNVPPFESREYCNTYTLPVGARLFSLTSHTHRHGVLWRTWLPPNEPCKPWQEACTPKETTPVYLSTEYNDPVQLEFETPIPYTSTEDADRTLMFCSVFDNGETPASPTVKRQSTSPPGPLGIGGPCADDVVACMDGPNRGELCGGDDANCPGSICDACPLRGGGTTEDEMFILYGSFYVIP